MIDLMQKYKNRRYILILGSGRNGTTFLAKELAKSKNITTTPEDKYFFWTMASRKQFNLNKINDTKEFMNNAFNFIFNFRKQDFYDDENTIKLSYYEYENILINNFNLFQSLNNNKKYKLIFDLILDIFAENKNKRNFVLHTPANILVFNTLVNIINPYKIILMQRNVKTFFVSSMKGNNKWFDSSIDCIVYWNFVADNLYKLQKKYKNSILIHQEEMLEKPEVIKNIIKDYLKIDLSNIDLSNKGDNTYFNKKFNREILLSSSEIKLIEKISAKNMTRFNYSLEYKDLKINLKEYILIVKSMVKIKINYSFRKIGFYFLLLKAKKILKNYKRNK
jgi:hypothetical protein